MKLLRLQPISSTKKLIIIIQDGERAYLMVRLSIMSGYVSKIFCSSSKETEPFPSVSA